MLPIYLGFHFNIFLAFLFDEINLDILHLKSKDYNEFKDVLELGYINDKDTDLHKIF